MKKKIWFSDYKIRSKQTDNKVAITKKEGNRIKKLGNSDGVHMIMKHKHKWFFIKEVTVQNLGKDEDGMVYFYDIYYLRFGCECGKVKEVKIK